MMFKNKLSKVFTRVLISIPVLLFLVSNSATAAKSKVVLNVQNGEEIRYLDPQLSTGMGSANISINLFEGLYDYGHKDGEPVKGLALSHTSNKDASVWTFKLRKDFSWVKYDGKQVKKMRPITAHDVVYSYRRILNPATASEYAYMLYILKNAKNFNKGKLKDASKVGVKALDDHTVQLTLEGPVPSLIQYLPHHSFGVVPKEPIEKHKEKWVTKGNMWTSGAYAFKDWLLKDKIILVKNPFYPEAKKVQVDEINFNFIGTYSPEAVRAFRAGKNDIDLESPPPSELTSLVKGKYVKAARMLGTYFVRVNVNRKPMNDARIRKALALTIPRHKIVKYIMKAGEVPTTSFVPNAMSGYDAVSFTDEKDYKKNLQQAKKLLAEAGYPDGKGFPKIKYLYNTAENHKKIAVLLSKTWKENLGIDVVPENQEWKVYLNTQKAQDYDVSRSGWIADMADPMNFLEMFITDGGNNNTGFSSAEYDRLISQAQTEKDLEKRSKIMAKIENILMSELPVLPIFNYTALSLVQPYVTGFYANKMDQHPMKYIKIDVAKRKKLFPGMHK